MVAHGAAHSTGQTRRTEARGWSALRAYVGDVETMFRVKSDLQFAILAVQGGETLRYAGSGRHEHRDRRLRESRQIANAGERGLRLRPTKARRRGTMHRRWRPELLLGAGCAGRSTPGGERYWRRQT